MGSLSIMGGAQNLIICVKMARGEKWIGKIFSYQGAKEVIFKACHSSKLNLAYTSPNVISASPKNVLMSRIDFTVLL